MSSGDREKPPGYTKGKKYTPHKITPVLEAELHLDEPLTNDLEFRTLVGGMTEREVEFTKALVISGGIKTNAAMRIYPQRTKEQCGAVGSDLWRKGRVQKLYHYLIEKQRETHHIPLTAEEFQNGLVRGWRMALRDKDLTNLNKLSVVLAKLDKSLVDRSTKRDDTGVDDAMSAVDSLLEE